MHLQAVRRVRNRLLHHAEKTPVNGGLLVPGRPTILILLAKHLANRQGCCAARQWTFCRVCRNWLTDWRGSRYNTRFARRFFAGAFHPAVSSDEAFQWLLHALFPLNRLSPATLDFQPRK
jgi:hypothetical protein